MAIAPNTPGVALLVMEATGGYEAIKERIVARVRKQLDKLNGLLQSACGIDPAAGARLIAELP